MLQDPARQATLKAISYARQHGMIVSFDLNVRSSLWKNEERLRKTIFSVLPDVDVLKLSDEELLFLAGKEDEDVIDEWMKEYNLSLIFLTKGAKGSRVFTKTGSAEIEAMNVKVVDTTGAGDAFVSGFLYSLNEREQSLDSIRVEETSAIARFASVSGGLAASQKRAMTALPTLAKVNKMMTGIG